MEFVPHPALAEDQREGLHERGQGKILGNGARQKYCTVAVSESLPRRDLGCEERVRVATITVECARSRPGQKLGPVLASPWWYRPGTWLEARRAPIPA